MQRRTRVNLLLAGCVAMLAALLWLSRPPTPPPRPPLVTTPPQAIEHIVVQPGRDAERIVLQRHHGNWHLNQPVDARADTHAVQALLELAAVVPARRLPATAIDAKQAGLATLDTSVRFGDAPVIRIGARTPLNTRRNTRYLAIGDQVVLAAVPHARLLDRHWPQWLSPHILAADARLTRIRLPNLTLRRAATGGWHVIPEARDRGADAAQFLVDAWRRARATRITRAGDRPAIGHVELRFADGHARQLAIVARQPQLLLRDPALGVTYHVRAGRGATLLRLRRPGSPSNTRHTDMRQ